MFHPDFDKVTAVWKGVKTFLKAAVAVTAAIEGAVQGLGLPNTYDAFKVAWLGYVVALLFAVVRTEENVRKNGNGPDNPAPMWEWGDIPRWFGNLSGILRS
jgi:hypothetical protein